MSKGESTRERIVDCAIKLASVEGLNGLTIGRLADGVGMSKSGLFAHFRSKEELQIQVLHMAAELFRAAVVDPARATPPGEERFRVLLDRWITWEADREVMPGGCIFTQVGAELDDQPGPVRECLIAFQRQWIDALVAFARSAAKAGRFREDTDPHLFAYQFQGILMATHHFSRLLRDPASRDRAHAALEALLASARRPISR